MNIYWLAAVCLFMPISVSLALPQLSPPLRPTPSTCLPLMTSRSHRWVWLLSKSSRSPMVYG